MERVQFMGLFIVRDGLFQLTCKNCLPACDHVRFKNIRPILNGDICEHFRLFRHLQFKKLISCKSVKMRALGVAIERVVHPCCKVFEIVQLPKSHQKHQEVLLGVLTFAQVFVHIRRFLRRALQVLRMSQGDTALWSAKFGDGQVVKRCDGTVAISHFQHQVQLQLTHARAIFASVKEVEDMRIGNPVLPCIKGLLRPIIGGGGAA